MQKSILFFGVIASAPLVALYNGSPSLPQMPEKDLWISSLSPFSAKVCVQHENLWHRGITVSSCTSPYIHSSLNGAGISWGFIDRVEAYVLLGSEKITLRAEQEGHSFQIKTSPSFGGEIGVRATAVTWGIPSLALMQSISMGGPKFPH